MRPPRMRLGTAVAEADTAPAAREVGMSRQPSCLARLRSHLLSTTGVRYRASPPSHRLTSRIASHERLQRISAGCGAPGEPGQNIQHAHNRSVGMKSVTIAGPPLPAPSQDEQDAMSMSAIRAMRAAGVTP